MGARERKQRKGEIEPLNYVELKINVNMLFF